jgi:hypothetical protein
VVVGDFDFVRIACLPAETKPELIVDSNAVLPLPVAHEALKTVSLFVYDD